MIRPHFPSCSKGSKSLTVAMPNAPTEGQLVGDIPEPLLLCTPSGQCLATKARPVRCCSIFPMPQPGSTRVVWYGTLPPFKGRPTYIRSMQARATCSDRWEVTSDQLLRGATDKWHCPTPHPYHAGKQRREKRQRSGGQCLGQSLQFKSTPARPSKRAESRGKK